MGEKRGREGVHSKAPNPNMDHIFGLSSPTKPPNNTTKLPS